MAGLERQVQVKSKKPVAVAARHDIPPKLLFETYLQLVLDILIAQVLIADLSAGRLASLRVGKNALDYTSSVIGLLREG